MSAKNWAVKAIYTEAGQALFRAPAEKVFETGLTQDDAELNAHVYNNETPGNDEYVTYKAVCLDA